MRFKYLFCDGVYFEMRVARTIERVPVLVVIGVAENGQKQVIGIQSGDKESASSWRETFKDLKRRGLDSRTVTLGIIDELSGLEKVFRGEFPKGKIQRCQVHVTRNILAKVLKKLKQEVADDIRSIFYAYSREKALEFSSRFTERWQKKLKLVKLSTVRKPSRKQFLAGGFLVLLDDEALHVGGESAFNTNTGLVAGILHNIPESRPHLVPLGEGNILVLQVAHSDQQVPYGDVVDGG